MYSGSPYLLHLVLLEYVYRWNLRMAIKNRGLDPEIGGFYNQHVLEEINFMTEPHVDVVPYAAWGSILDYEDNGERMGLRRTVFGGTPESSEFNGGIQEAEFDLPADQPDFNLTQSATMYAKLQDLRTPVASVATDEERAKFWELLPRFLAPAHDIDASFSEFAEEWNWIISNPDAGISVKNLRCKTAAQLKSFYKTVLAGFNNSAILPPAIPQAPILPSSRRPHHLAQTSDGLILNPTISNSATAVIPINHIQPDSRPNIDPSDSTIHTSAITANTRPICAWQSKSSSQKAAIAALFNIGVKWKLPDSARGPVAKQEEKRMSTIATV
ncbi:hypothetical protein HDU80_006712 [Chytriomyces hyalinus]|nr:hypothetical protein HDU80_006712 [Chytriomyces hyalinus]